MANKPKMDAYRKRQDQASSPNLPIFQHVCNIPPVPRLLKQGSIKEENRIPKPAPLHRIIGKI